MGMCLSDEARTRWNGTRRSCPGRSLRAPAALVAMARFGPAAWLLVVAAVSPKAHWAPGALAAEHSEYLLTSVNPWGRSFLAVPQSEQRPRWFHSSRADDC